MNSQPKKRPEYPVSEIFVNRWSPRKYSTKKIEKDKLNILFEAARWAPSCYNDQPWMFVYADNEQDLPAFRELLVEQNRTWADSVPFLAILFARKAFTFNDNENWWAEFDAGSAWMSFALQASELGLYAHGMAGFYKDKACAALNVPEDKYFPIAAIALGYAEENSDEPQGPDRNPISSFVHSGKYSE